MRTCSTRTPGSTASPALNTQLVDELGKVNVCVKFMANDKNRVIIFIKDKNPESHHLLLDVDSRAAPWAYFAKLRLCSDRAFPFHAYKHR